MPLLKFFLKAKVIYIVHPKSMTAISLPVIIIVMFSWCEIGRGDDGIRTSDTDLINLANCIHLGDAHFQQREYDSAIAEYDKAIQIDPKNAKAFESRGRTYFAKKEFDLSIEDSSRAIQLNSDDWLAYYMRGLAYLQNQNYQAGVADLEQVVSLDPIDADSYDLLAEVWATCQSPNFRNGSKAVQYATAACNLTDWSKPSTIRTLASAYAEKGDFDNAVKWQKYFLTFPQQDPLKQELGEHRLRLYQSHQPYHVTH